MVKLKRFKYEFDFAVESELDFRKLRLVHNECQKSDRRVLYVLDYVPKKDLYNLNGKLLSGTSQETFINLLGMAHLDEHDWLVCSYHACKTFGQSEGFVTNAIEAFNDRLTDIISQYQPTEVVIFGTGPFRFLCKKETEKCNGKLHNMINVPVNKTLNVDGKKIDFTVTKSVAIDGMFLGKEPSLSLTGYIARGLRNSSLGRVEHRAVRPEMKIVLIDTMQKVKKFLAMLWKEPVVSIDTETDNLYKIKNRVLTIQFSFDTETSYIIPLCHKDSPFDSKELNKIFEYLREYFEEGEADYHIYANAQFDLNVMRTQFGVRFFKTPVYDIFCGEYVLDENLKFLEAVGEGYYYSLGNLSVQYGDFSYLNAKFGKSDRATISKVDLNEDLLNYMGLDTVIPFAIHQQQIKRAKEKKYEKYMSMVTEQMSDVIHSLATLEYNGYPIDINYLYKLKLPDSPIEQEIEKLVSELVNSDAAKKVNRKILKEKGIPTTTLFGTETNVFSLRTKDHLYKLFFDVLKLDYVKKGKNGMGKIDKKFQEKHKDIPEVKAYTAWQKACKLRDSYVNQMLKFWGENEDFRSDKRVRCRYNYLKVITGRVSASEPGLQQIPSRSELGKHIKRLFIASRGKFIVKVDFRVHEVRCWGIISKENGIADAFSISKELIKEYRRNPGKEILDKIELEGDVHKVNSAYFFKKKITEVTKDDRNAIKGIVFGLIYGKLVSTMAKDMGQTLEYMEKLVGAFMNRFKKGTGWFETMKKNIARHYFVESPLGRRRNLYNIFAKSDSGFDYVKSIFDRRGVNSPVQGMGSDFMMIGIRSFCTMVWEYYKEHGYMPYIKPCVSVHDSLEVEVDYEHILLGINYIEQALTDNVKKIVLQRHGLKLNSELEIDYELGVTTDKLHKWFGDVKELEYIVYKSLLDQNEKLGYEYTDEEIAQHMNSCFKHKEFMPDWMIEQVKENSPRFLKYKFKPELVSNG